MDLPVTDEIVFDVICEDLGGCAADCATEDISVMADTWEELRGEVKAGRGPSFPKRSQAGLHPPAPSARRRHLSLKRETKATKPNSCLQFA